MKGRTAPLRIWSTEQTALHDDVITRLERDKLYFLENPQTTVFVRPFVAGEAEPYTPGMSGTVVHVERNGKRTFIVGEKPVLVIEFPFEKMTTKERYWSKKKKHQETSHATPNRTT